MSPVVASGVLGIIFSFSFVFPVLILLCMYYIYNQKQKSYFHFEGNKYQKELKNQTRRSQTTGVKKLHTKAFSAMSTWKNFPTVSCNGINLSVNIKTNKQINKNPLTKQLLKLLKEKVIIIIFSFPRVFFCIKPVWNTITFNNKY